MQPFTFHTPTRITFGLDTASGVGDIVKDLGGKKTFIVTDKILLKAGILDQILPSLKNGDGETEPVVFDDVPADSDVTAVNNACEAAISAGCDAVVAVGGGSVIDTAKVVDICLTFGGDMSSYQGFNNLPSRMRPLVCIPTTAGTGSEVSMVAVIKDREEGKKLLFGSPFLAPDAAVLDPALLVSLPPRLTAGTGIDALTHCLEAYVAVATVSPMTDSLCLGAMRLLFDNLRSATKSGDDIEARSATLVASTMAGLAFTNAGVGIVHALAHATGGRFGTHHGMTNAVFLRYGMEFNVETVADRYAYAARFLGLSRAADDVQAAKELIDAVSGLIEECGLPSRLAGLGVPEVTEPELEEIANQAITDAAIMFNPREATIEDIMRIYKEAS